MSACYLPSTLVKCLYLFFDLPPVTVGKGHGDITPAESRQLLQRKFTQVRVGVDQVEVMDATPPLYDAFYSI